MRCVLVVLRELLFDPIGNLKKNINSKIKGIFMNPQTSSEKNSALKILGNFGRIGYFYTVGLLPYDHQKKRHGIGSGVLVQLGKDSTEETLNFPLT